MRFDFKVEGALEITATLKFFNTDIHGKCGMLIVKSNSYSP
jgi:hypothetical protein